MMMSEDVDEDMEQQQQQQLQQTMPSQRAMSPFQFVYPPPSVASNSVQSTYGMPPGFNQQPYQQHMLSSPPPPPTQMQPQAYMSSYPYFPWVPRYFQRDQFTMTWFCIALLSGILSFLILLHATPPWLRMQPRQNDASCNNTGTTTPAQSQSPLAEPTPSLAPHIKHIACISMAIFLLVLTISFVSIQCMRSKRQRQQQQQQQQLAQASHIYASSSPPPPLVY